MNNSPLASSPQNSTTQLFHYALVGFASNFIGYMVYLLITHLSAAPKITMTLLYGIGVVISFQGNRKLTFNYEGNLLGSGIRYIIVHCCGYLINLSILITLVDKLGYNHQWVQAIAILIVAVFLFMSSKFFVFTKKY